MDIIKLLIIICCVLFVVVFIMFPEFRKLLALGNGGGSAANAVLNSKITVKINEKIIRILIISLSTAINIAIIYINCNTFVEIWQVYN